MSRQPATPAPIAVPANYPCSTFFVDESMAKMSGGSFFVVGAIKSRKPGALMREIKAIRDRHSYTGEFKFSRINRDRLPVFFDLIEALYESDAHIVATVVDKSVSNPFHRDEPIWRTHAKVASQLLVGGLNSREFGAAVLDQISTPVGESFDDTVRTLTNQRLRGIGLVSAICADSCTSDGLQLADLVAGAIARRRRDPDSTTSNHKDRVSDRLAAAFGVPSLSHDHRDDRVNIQTYGVPRSTQKSAGRKLQAVPAPKTAAS